MPPARHRSVRWELLAYVGSSVQHRAPILRHLDLVPALSQQSVCPGELIESRFRLEDGPERNPQNLELLCLP